jgi:ferredoxin
MLVLVDLNRCQSYGQCVFAAPDVFHMEHDETLEWNYRPEASETEKVLRAFHACPVQAITVTPSKGQP